MFVNINGQAQCEFRDVSHNLRRLERINDRVRLVGAHCQTYKHHKQSERILPSESLRPLLYGSLPTLHTDGTTNQEPSDRDKCDLLKRKYATLCSALEVALHDEPNDTNGALERFVPLHITRSSSHPTLSMQNVLQN